MDTTDSLLEERRDLSVRSLGLSSVATELLGDTGDGSSGSASLERSQRKICQRHARPGKMEGEVKKGIERHHGIH